MARPEKVAEVEAITTRIQSAQSMVLADFTGLTVLQMTEFRRRCRESSVECRVVKNRLARIAADDSGMEVMKDHLNGPTAIVFGAESQVDPAKIIAEFAKENEAMEIKGGFLDGEYLDKAQVMALAKKRNGEISREDLAAALGEPHPGDGRLAATRGVIPLLQNTTSAGPSGPRLLRVRSRRSWAAAPRGGAPPRGRRAGSSTAGGPGGSWAACP